MSLNDSISPRVGGLSSTNTRSPPPDTITRDSPTKECSPGPKLGAVINATRPTSDANPAATTIDNRNLDTASNAAAPNNKIDAAPSVA